MPVLPYQQQTALSGGGQEPYAQPLQVSDAVGQGLSNLATGVKNVGDAQYQLQAIHDETAVNELYATQFSPAVRMLLYDPNTGLMAKQGKDAMTALPEVEKMVDAVRVQARSSLQNENQQRMFDSMSRRHIEQEMDGAYRHATLQQNVWQQQTSNAVVSNQLQSAVDHFNDPKYVDNAIGAGLFEIQQYGTSHGQSAEVQLENSKSFVRQTRTAIAQRLLVQDPMAAQDYIREHAAELAGPQMAVLEHQVKQGVLPIEARRIADTVISNQTQQNVGAAAATGAQTSGSFDTAVQFVFSKEGGYSASDGNSGAPVNFGINQKANPDVDVKNLTKDGATQIYRDRYWNQIGADKLSPAAAIMAMDAAVNQGVPFAKQIVADSGGDVGKMAAMRRARYEEIVANDPSQAKYKDGWLARVDAAEQAGAAPGGGRAPLSTDIRAQMTDLIAKTEAEAEKTHPGDPVFKDMAVAQVKGHLNNIVAGQIAQQQQAHSVLINASMGTGKGSPKPTSLDELLVDPATRAAWTQTTPESQRGILALLDHNQKEALGTPAKSDPAVVQDTFARIHLPDDDPNKITLASQLAPLFAKGLNREDYDWMKKEIDAQQSVSGRNLTKDMQSVRQSAHTMLTRSTIGSVQPEVAEEAAYRFNADFASRVEAAVKAGKDPRTLLTPGTPDYVLAPERVMSYLQTPQAAVAAQAASIKRGTTRSTSGVITDAGAATLPATPVIPPGALMAHNPKTGETLISKDGGKSWTKP